jgi:hypothetical protein
MFTGAHHWSIYWASCIQSTPSNPLYLKSILILSSHLCIGLPSSLFRFSNQNIVCISPMHATLPLILLDLVTLIMSGEVYKLWNSSLCSLL